MSEAAVLVVDTPVTAAGIDQQEHLTQARLSALGDRIAECQVEDILAELGDRISTPLERSSNPRLRELVEKYGQVSPHLMRLATGGPTSLENGILSLASKKAHVLNCSTELAELGKSLRLIQELQGINLPDTDATELDRGSAKAQAELPALLARLNRVIARQEELEDDAREILKGTRDRDATSSV
ncbi:hypothetical protein FOZ63_018327 [Perkinsus olseni]|uniref:Uncharacterized protein n=2 Tax=Perkinsus olseni TaxID=32597 RepID=A0A7J6QTZ1_PEROL|nr:hypothetical protein FOZ63_018327 [Perkinsus olseni]